jgi:hypothetical protein
MVQYQILWERAERIHPSGTGGHSLLGTGPTLWGPGLKLQAASIADHYAQVSNEYEPIKTSDFEEYSDLSKLSPITVDPEKL